MNDDDTRDHPSPPWPALEDPEGDSIPPALPPMVDAHIHLFPEALFRAVWRWFDNYGWPIRYRLTAPDAVGFLLARGVDRMVAHHYAHKPGISRPMNAYMAGLCQDMECLTGTAAVFPGEEGAVRILEEAFALGLEGVKLHAHVQYFDLNGREVREICEVCEANGKPLVVHAGREPRNAEYLRDPYELCSADRVERVLLAHPRLRVCVPHLGANEFEAYRRMIEDYDTLWLDTTMTLGDYLPVMEGPPLAEYRSDRILFGTDFPHIPYAWDRELNHLLRQGGLSEGALKRILGENAREFYRISM